jgi:hypothetical protein
MSPDVDASGGPVNRAGGQVEQRKVRASPRTPPEGAALWTPAKDSGPWNPIVAWDAGEGGVLPELAESGMTTLEKDHADAAIRFRVA